MLNQERMFLPDILTNYYCLLDALSTKSIREIIPSQVVNITQ